MSLKSHSPFSSSSRSAMVLLSSSIDAKAYDFCCGSKTYMLFLFLRQPGLSSQSSPNAYYAKLRYSRLFFACLFMITTPDSCSCVDCCLTSESMAQTSSPMARRIASNRAPLFCFETRYDHSKTSFP